MNILRLSTLSLTLAIAVLTLGYVTNPSAAPKKCIDSSLPGCGGEDETETVFEVAMQAGDLDEDEEGLVTSIGACGIVEGARNDSVRFPDGCVPGVLVDYITGPSGGPLTLTAFTLGVRFNKSDMLIFFTDGEIENGHNTGDVYVSERLPVTIIPEGSSIRVQVNDGVGLAVEKNHQPGKGDLVGPLAIGDIFFKAIA